MRLDKLLIVIIGILIGVTGFFEIAKADTVQDDLVVEGIVFEARAPENSVAVINGEFLRAGDQYDSYEIIQVEERRVIVRNNQTGKEELIEVQNDANIMTDYGGRRSKTLMDYSESSLENMLRVAEELDVITEMQNIHLGIVLFEKQFHALQGSVFDKLVKGGLLEGFSSTGVKGDYRYSVLEVESGIRIFADPVNPESEPKHYMLDENGQFFVEEGKRASKYSREYESHLEVSE